MTVLEELASLHETAAVSIGNTETIHCPHCRQVLTVEPQPANNSGSYKQYKCRNHKQPTFDAVYLQGYWDALMFVSVKAKRELEAMAAFSESDLATYILECVVGTAVATEGALEFANSLLKKLANGGELTDSQMNYVLGENAPNGMPTFQKKTGIYTVPSNWRRPA